MALRLASGSVTPARAAEEPVGRLHVDQVDVELAAEGLLHLLGLPGPHEAGVDEDAGELVADGLVHEGGGHGRVDAARQARTAPGSAPTWARTAATADSMIVGVGPRRAGSRRRRNRKRSKRSWPALGVDHLGVELHPVDAAARGRRGRRPGASGVDAVATKPGGHLGDGVAVAHPHVDRPAAASRRTAARCAGARSSAVRPYSPRPVRVTVPPSCWVSSWAP